MADPYAPNEDWYEGYDAGFSAGYDKAMNERRPSRRVAEVPRHMEPDFSFTIPKKKKRKLSAWQKFVKVNSKKPRFRFKSGSKKGKINLKALGVAYRKTPAGKKKR